MPLPLQSWPQETAKRERASDPYDQTPLSLPHLRKFSSAPGTRPVAAEGLSEKTSTRRLPAPAGAPEAATGAARRPSKSADGDGVDCEEAGEEENK